MPNADDGKTRITFRIDPEKKERVEYLLAMAQPDKIDRRVTLSDLLRDCVDDLIDDLEDLVDEEAEKGNPKAVTAD